MKIEDNYEFVYRIATPEELEMRGICEEYDTLLGPDEFECILTEPEDRFWYRDASPVITRLNGQHAKIERQQRAMSRALAIAKDGEADHEHADLVSIWKILESALPTPEPPDA